jgi:hypothetical protein
MGTKAGIVIKNDEVNITGKIQLLRPQFAHANDDKPRVGGIGWGGGKLEPSGLLSLNKAGLEGFFHSEAGKTTQSRRLFQQRQSIGKFRVGKMQQQPLAMLAQGQHRCGDIVGGDSGGFGF